MTLHFQTKDSPSAHGKTPQEGDLRWTLRFPLEDGQTLLVTIGRTGRESLRDMLRQEDEEDARTPHLEEPCACPCCGEMVELQTMQDRRGETYLICRTCYDTEEHHA